MRKLWASICKRFFIAFTGGFSVGKAYGARFLFDWRHSLDKKVAVGLYERGQIAHMVGQVGAIQPDVFLDVGAHAALYSVVLKKTCPDLEVHSFEPDRKNLCQLYGNLFVNGLTDKVSVHEYGVSDSSGKAAFIASDSMSSRGTRRVSDDGESTIPVKRLDDVFSYADKKIALKIDVEGHEQHVIRGAEQLLKSNSCYLQIESSEKDFVMLKSMMESLGYRHVATVGDYFFTNIPS